MRQLDRSSILIAGKIVFVPKVSPLQETQDVMRTGLTIRQLSVSKIIIKIVILIYASIKRKDAGVSTLQCILNT